MIELESITHGHVWKHRNGSVARCGGPAICSHCQLEAEVVSLRSIIRRLRRESMERQKIIDSTNAAIACAPGAAVSLRATRDRQLAFFDMQTDYLCGVPNANERKLHFPKRPRIVNSDVARRRIWQSKCGWWRVVHSASHYGLPDSWNVTRYNRMYGCWDIIGRHRTKRAAFEAAQRAAAHEG